MDSQRFEAIKSLRNWELHLELLKMTEPELAENPILKKYTNHLKELAEEK